MLREARNEWVASFDDDSYPIADDYFLSLSECIDHHPEASVIASVIRHRNPQHDSPPFEGEREVAAFVGCGCCYRRSAFLETDGYVPLPVAYGMEEVDLALQLHQRSGVVLESSELVVFHDTDLSHHQSARITAGSIMNQALIAWVRYPVGQLPYGVLSWANKIWDNLRRGRILGVLRGVVGTPFHLWKYRALRVPVSEETLRRFLELRG